jgi:hypothetical protein
MARYSPEGGFDRPETIKAQDRESISHLGLRGGAGDGNRTRTVSLGINRQAQATRPDLGDRVSMSDRDGPWFTVLNGTLMARRSCF